MKRILLTIFIMTTLGVCWGQKPENGIYVNGMSSICVANDTIYMDLRGGRYFKGFYQLADDEFVLGENELLGMNAEVEIEKCHPDSIEIEVICTYWNIPLGFPINKDEQEVLRHKSKCFSVELNQTSAELCHGNGTCLYIGREEISENMLKNGFVLDVDDATFCDFFDFPLEYGKRYIFKEKVQLAIPIFEHDKGIRFCFDYDNKTIIDKSIYCNGCETIYNYAGECDSCNEVFKKHYSKLFE